MSEEIQQNIQKLKEKSQKQLMNKQQKNKNKIQQRKKEQNYKLKENKHYYNKPKNNENMLNIMALGNQYVPENATITCWNAQDNPNYKWWEDM